MELGAIIVSRGWFLSPACLQNQVLNVQFCNLLLNLCQIMMSGLVVEDPTLAGQHPELWLLFSLPDSAYHVVVQPGRAEPEVFQSLG